MYVVPNIWCPTWVVGWPLEAISRTLLFYLSDYWDILHLKVNMRNRGEGLTGTSKGGNRIEPKCARGVKAWKYLGISWGRARMSSCESHEPWSKAKMKQIASTHEIVPLNGGCRKTVARIQWRTKVYPLDTFSKERTGIQNSYQWVG